VARGGGQQWLAGVYLGALAMLAATTAAAVGWDWPGLAPGTAAVFAALAALAWVMAGVAAWAWHLSRRRPPGWRRRFVTAAGFTLIALLVAFVIITVLDAGAPSWAVAAAAVAAVLAGRWPVGRAETTAAQYHGDQAAQRPPRQTASRR
jgi:hypothetical protein